MSGVVDGIINYIGVDVGKFKLDLFLSTDGECRTIENNEKAINDFLKELDSNKSITQKNTCIILDLTGGYEVLFRDLFYNAGYKYIILAEGKKVKNFAKSLKNVRTKTDRIDCYILAEYGRKFIGDLNFYIPISDGRRQIGELYARIQDLKQLKQQEKNRFLAPNLNSKIKDSIRKHVELLEVEIKDLQIVIDTIIENDQELKIISDFLNSIKGIKKEISQMLIATLPELGRVNRKTIASISGTAPVANDSGTIMNHRYTAGGRPIIKKSLFICILSQIRYNDEYKSSMEKMIQRGKSKMQCITALMRKFIVKLNAQIRDELLKNGLV